MVRGSVSASRTAGFTMIEVMVVTIIMGILALGGSILMRNIQNYSLMNRARLRTQQENRNIMNIFTKEIREARADTIAIGAMSGQPAASMITFLRAGDPGRADVQVSFYQNGDHLYHVQGTDKPADLTSNLRFVAFTFPRTESRSLVSVSVGLEMATFRGKDKALRVSSEEIQVVNP